MNPSIKIRNEYLLNPKLCLHCKEPMLPKPHEKLAWVKKKKFCSQKCNGNALREGRGNNLIPYNTNRKGKGKRPFIKCIGCVKNANDGIQSRTKRRYCKQCIMDKMKITSSSTKRDSTHPKIRSHARSRYKANGGQMKCLVCNYLTYVEICHIKAVKDFSDDDVLDDINDIDNLIALCRNHHWELDHGIINLKQIEQDG